MKVPVRYAEAQRALAAATRIDEVKDIRDKAMAMEVYAYQANDPDLAANSVEIRRRAVRRIGELMEEMRVLGKLAKGGQPHQRKSTGGKKPPVETLAKQGVDKDLAKAARAAAKVSAAKYEKDTEKARKIAAAHAMSNTAVIKEARAERHKEKRAKRTKREKDLAAKVTALPERKYGVVLADPEWRFEFWSQLGLTNSSADNHYSTSALEIIKQRDVSKIAADDCVLWLWATVPMLPQALEVMSAWGFTYKSNFAWGKDKAGTGYWNRNKHELLLVGTRGKIPAPAEGDQWESLIIAPRLRHSEKPKNFYELIEAYFPTIPKIELNCRGAPRAGWDAWGNEADEADEAVSGVTVEAAE